MTSLSLVYDDKDITDRLRLVVDRAKKPLEAHRRITTYLLQQNILRFSEQTGPDGVPWIPSQRALNEGGQTLLDQGILRGSITGVFTENESVIGTTLLKALPLQEGVASRGLPARPFIGIAADEMITVLSILDNYIAEPIA